jgi:hypothetical protein
VAAEPLAWRMCALFHSRFDNRSPRSSRPESSPSGRMPGAGAQLKTPARGQQAIKGRQSASSISACSGSSSSSPNENTGMYDGVDSVRMKNDRQSPNMERVAVSGTRIIKQACAPLSSLPPTLAAARDGCLRTTHPGTLHRRVPRTGTAASSGPRA